uniref:Ovule protein n=1 Tax=Steinernema glaseri TaxID=37863 RepID=A0A1I7Y9T4_9BILA
MYVTSKNIGMEPGTSYGIWLNETHRQEAEICDGTTTANEDVSHFGPFMTFVIMSLFVLRSSCHGTSSHQYMSLLTSGSTRDLFHTMYVM